MNLNEIGYSIKENPPKTEIELQSRVLNYCIKNKIDFIEVSTVGKDWSKVNKFSREVFYNEPFATKKETIKETNDRLIRYINENYINKKDCVVLFSTFFGMTSCKFYDAETNKNININGIAREQQKAFVNLVDLYHTL